MPLESPVTQLSHLNEAWPLGSDDRQYGDDHLRNIKSAVKSLLTNPQQIGLPTFSGNGLEIVRVNSGATALETIPAGSGGGLDADTVDGSHATDFLAKSTLSAKGSLVAASAAATPSERTVGTNGQLLKADSTHTSGLSWQSQGSGNGLDADTLDGSHLSALVAKSLGTTKGDLIGFSGSATPVRVGVGTNGQVLTADSSAASGVAWAAAAGGGAGLKSVQVFTSNGTWTRPSGVTMVLIIAKGGGGGGGAGSASGPQSGGGGGEGATAYKVLDVSAISSAAITAGAGGAAGVAGSNSSFAANCIGLGGAAAGAATAAPGAGGFNSVCDWEERGASGTPGTYGTTYGYGGTGGGRGGGTGGGLGSNGNAGTRGGGGGGGGLSAGPLAGTGGAGGSGYVIVLEFGS